MIITTDNDMRLLGERVARQLRGGECIELVGDVGAGKTTFTQGLGNGLEADDEVQSPSFTISREYACRDGLRLAHYDFYRLSDGGIMHHELAESVQDPHTITVVEWAETIAAVLPDNRIIIRIAPEPTGEARSVGIQGLTI